MITPCFQVRAVDDAGNEHEGMRGDWRGFPGGEGWGNFWFWPPLPSARKSVRVTVSTLWEAAWAEIELPRYDNCCDQRRPLLRSTEPVSVTWLDTPGETTQLPPRRHRHPLRLALCRAARLHLMPRCPKPLPKCSKYRTACCREPESLTPTS